MKPNDFGPLYAETIMGRFPVEPWNTCTNISFLIVLIYWLRKTGFDSKKHILFTFSYPILLVGFIGGTVFHATRSHSIWLILDFVPISLLAVAASYFFWQQIISSRVVSGLLILAPVLGSRVLRQIIELPRHARISFGYAGLAVSILLPAFIVCYSMRGRGLISLLIACTSFGLALLCRQIDAGVGAEIFPMGTHPFWHLFGALSVHFVMKFAYTVDCHQLEQQEIGGHIWHGESSRI